MQSIIIFCTMQALLPQKFCSSNPVSYTIYVSIDSGNSYIHVEAFQHMEKFELTDSGNSLGYSNNGCTPIVTTPLLYILRDYSISLFRDSHYTAT